MEKIEENNNPKITVITPTYNRAYLIRQTIESIINQDFIDFEYYILDDGSTDNTEEIVKPFLEDKRIKYLKHANAGEAETVNWGWSLAKGEYFTQVNSDDPILPGLFSEMVKVLDERKNIVVAYSDFYFIDEDGKVTNKVITADWNFLKLLNIYSCECATPGTFIRRKTFSDWKKIKDKRFKYIGDTYMYWNMALIGDFYRVPKFLATWRDHTGGISVQRWRAIPEIEIWFKEYFAQRNLPELVLRCKNKVEETLYSYFIRLLNDSDDVNKKERINHFKRLLFYKKIINGVKLKIGRKSYSPLVSVVIPVYNGSDYIRGAINSALAQTYKNIEVIVVNDGSTDNTEEIALSYGNKIRYFKKENGGTATALNLGIKKSKGKYISWLSHDDLYYPNKIYKQIGYIRNNIVDENKILYSDYLVLDLVDNTSHREVMHPVGDFIPSRISILKLLFLSGLHGCTMLIPKECFEKVGYFDPKLKTTQDYDLWLKFIDYGYDFKYLNEVLISVRHHDKQGSVIKKKLCDIEIEKLYTKAFNMFYQDIITLPTNEFIEFINCVKRKGLKKLSNFMQERIKKIFDFSNLQVGDNDLIGNKFNGHDLHLYLNDKGIKSKHLVWNKESNDKETFEIARDNFNRKEIYRNTSLIQKQYSINGFLNPLWYDVLYDPLFLNSELVHFHLVHNGLVDLHLLPLMSRLKPIVWTLHDPWAFSEKYIDFLDDSALSYELKKTAIQNSKIEVIVASKFMLDSVKKSPIFKDKNIHLIPFGINQNIFKKLDKKSIRKKFKIPLDSLVISFRSDNISIKGVDYVEYVIKNLKTEKDVYFISFGGGDFYKNKKFKYIEFGWIKDDLLMADIYNASDLFLMPSTLEAFGMMAIEAMSCGVVPFVLEGTSLPEVTNAPECGVSVKRDKDEYLRIVQYYIDNEKERKEKSNKCLEFAKANYNKEVYIEKLINVYNETKLKFKITNEDRQLIEQLKMHPILEFSNNIQKIVKNNDFLSKKKILIKNYLRPFIAKYKKYIPLQLRAPLKKKLGYLFDKLPF